jgi:hypothetical protein
MTNINERIDKLNIEIRKFLEATRDLEFTQDQKVRFRDLVNTLSLYTPRPR